MFKVVGCFVAAHDLKLVALAALICMLSSFTVVELLRHGRKVTKGLSSIWLGVAAVAGGSGIWATHFVAMLAFSPGVPAGYDLRLTLLSLAYAVLLCGLGFIVAGLSRSIAINAIGGAVVGGGIAVMHYTGMAAFEVAGLIHYDAVLITASVVLGGLLGALALTIGLRGTSYKSRALGAGTLVLAICAHHFTGMGALTIIPDPRVAISPSDIPSSWLAVGVTFASIVILLLAAAALGLDVRDRRHSAVEGERLRSLANAAVEGLLVCKGEVIVSANRSFATLVGLDIEATTGARLADFLPHYPMLSVTDATLEQPAETELRRADGTDIPVELIVQPVEYANKPHYAIAVRDLRARRRAESQINFLAHHDPLTGLANRASFNRRFDLELTAAESAGRRLAVLCLDLDRFKEVNDLFGHAAGDAMLESVARVLTEVTDPSQLVARLGGDEFAVLMPCDDALTAGTLAERIIDRLRDHVVGAGPQIATSLGIAVYPDDAKDRNALLNSADTALYKAKNEGRGTYRYFEPRMGAQVHERRMLEHDLRHGVARGEIRLVYQPQNNIGSGALTGFEALVRWQHPKRGAVSPSTFIPIAEESGIIMQLGEWVLREACREAATWTNPLSIAVNVSAVQIHSPQFATLVHEVLLSTGLSPSRLELEVTETALIRDTSRALLTLRQLKALGVRIAMDDFGTGYSSLSNLRAFPFDMIKIDASFIRSVDTNEQTAAIVRSVLGLGRGLGVPVLAEGVETDAELRFLSGEFCDAAQGYLFGRPAPIEDFADAIHAAGAPMRADHGSFATPVLARIA